MERTFKQELDFAMEHKINVLKLNIANEVSDQLVNGYWWFEQDAINEVEHTMQLFEDICNCVCEIYLKIDNTYSLANVVQAVIELNIQEYVDISEINKYMVIEYIQDNF